MVLRIERDACALRNDGISKDIKGSRSKGGELKSGGYRTTKGSVLNVVELRWMRCNGTT